MRHSKRIVTVDVLRGIAITFVMLFHLLEADFGKDHPGFRNHLLDFDGVTRSWWFFTPFAFGWSGVALFFVISGYVIHRSYLRSGSFDLFGFALRRFWRIYPAYLVFLIGFTLFYREAFVSKDFILHLFLLHNVTEETFFGNVNGSFWSLAVECQLYAMYPIAILARKFGGWKWMISLGIVVALIWLAISYKTIDLLPANHNVWLSPFALWPSWLIGAVIAEHHAKDQQLFKSGRPVALSMTLLCVLACSVQPLYPLAFLAAAFGWAPLLDFYCLGERKTSALSSMIAFLGVISYSVYLVHQPVMSSFTHVTYSMGLLYHPVAGVLLGMVLFIPGIVCLGWLSYAVIERPGIWLGQLIEQGENRRRRLKSDSFGTFSDRV
jgi:peptidoglycan/LPS O-acetylase OafA/YrhL